MTRNPKKPDKTLVILSGEIKTPPLSTEARREAGFLRIQDDNTTWRIMYRIDPDEILILDVFSKKTQKTPAGVVAACKARLKKWDEV